jgi:hypothetical protein
VLSRIGGFTSARQAEVARRVRRDQLADRRTAARASAALREANPAADLLARIEAETTTPDHVQRGALAHALSNIADDETVYWKTLATEAHLSKRLAPVLTAKAHADKAWARQVKKRAFKSQKAATDAYRRNLGGLLAPGYRLMRRENVLQRENRHASRSFASDLSSLRFALRNYPDARRMALRLMRDDPRGFLAERFKRSN